MFTDALEQARELDHFFKTTGQTVGPFHGIPMTLKDQFNVKGYDTTLGYVGRANNPATADAHVVQVMKSLGAVVLAKTNLPQYVNKGKEVHSQPISVRTTQLLL